MSVAAGKKRHVKEADDAALALAKGKKIKTAEASELHSYTHAQMQWIKVGLDASRLGKRFAYRSKLPPFWLNTRVDRHKLKQCLVQESGYVWCRMF